MINAYWWTPHANFGDYLTPLLLEKFSDLHVQWSPVEEAHIIVVGSILEHLPRHWHGAIVGAGKLHEHSHVDLGEAAVLALRGALSARGVRGDFVLGDPGLLCSEIVEPTNDKEFDLTVVPHWSDHQLAQRFAHLNPHVINPSHDPLTIIGEIARSKKIVSSSLHGIVIADSFRIPRRAERFPHMDKVYEGGEFKFHDYSSVLGEEMPFGVLHTPKDEGIERVQADLFDVFRHLARSN